MIQTLNWTKKKGEKDFPILGGKSHQRTWKEREEGEDVCVNEEGDFPILRTNM